MIETDRLILRRWRDSDRAPFAAMNADPAVMAHFPAQLDRGDSDALIDRFESTWVNAGIGFAAAEHRSHGAFIGMAGLSHVTSAGPCEGAVEIGWRLARPFWGHGLASEAARAWLAHGFTALNASEIIAFTAHENQRSQAVMRRLGMSRDPGRDFDHRGVAQGNRLRPHLVYALSRAQWMAKARLE